MRLFLFFTLSFLIIFSSCKKEEIPTPIKPSKVQETYQSIKNILEINCINCHSASGSASFLDLTLYIYVKTYLDGNNSFTDRISSDDEFYRMPPSGDLSEEEKNRLIDWVNTGYLE